jgi:hypothetical protein
MFKKNLVKTIVGWTIVLGHIGILVYVFLGKSDTWDVDRKMSAALTVAPVFTAYFVAVVKNFIAKGEESGPGPMVNYNYAAISFFVPACLLAGVAYVVYAFPSEQFSEPERLQQVLAGLEVCLGGVVGFVVDNLFPRPEKE